MTIIYLKIAANADGTTVYVRLCLRIWIAENIGSLGSQTDATNLKYILCVRADELEKAATIKGFYGELTEAVRPYGGIEGYVRHQLRKRIQAQRQADLD